MTRRQPGFTLIELVIAIVLLSIGTTALAATAAAVARQMAVSSRRSRAAFLARSRAEESNSRQCAALAAGTQELAGIRSVWDVSRDALSAELEQHVAYGSLLGVHADVYRSTSSCE